MELEELLRPGYQFARELLADSDGFPPFAVVLDLSGTHHVLVAEDGSPQTIREEVAKLHRQTPLEVVMLFSEAEVQQHGTPIQRLIHVHVQVRDGLNKLVLTPFVTKHGVLELGQPSIRDADDVALPGL